MNRYTDLSVAQFNPLSLQEVMMTPTIKRQQHDDILNKQDLLAAELSKIDPHDKYYNRAKEIKDQMNAEFEDVADQLSREGVNTQTKDAFRKTYRNYNNLTSPTGEIGMINNHKIKLNETIQTYLKDGAAHGLTMDEMMVHVNEAMTNHTDLDKTPLYDDRGRVIDFKIDKQLVKSQNAIEEFQKIMQNAGIHSSEWGDVASRIKYDPKHGMTYVESGGSKHGRSNNSKNVKAALDLMDAQILDGTSDLAKYLDYSRKDVNSVLSQMALQAGIYKKDSKSDFTEHSISNLIKDPVDNGGGSEDTISTPYSSNIKTAGIGENYDEVKTNAEKVVNNPDADNNSKQKALLVLDAIKKVDNQLFGDDVDASKHTPAQKNMRALRNPAILKTSEFYKNLESEVNKVNQHVKNLEKHKDSKDYMGDHYRSFINYKKELDTIFNDVKTGNTKDFNAEKLDKLFSLKNRSLRTAGYNVYGDDFKKAVQKQGDRYTKNSKLIETARNETISKEGFETTKYVMDTDPSKQKDLFTNIANVIDPNNFKINNITVSAKDGNIREIKLNENGGYNMVESLALAAKNGELAGGNITTSEDGTIGVQVEFISKDDREVLGSTNTGWGNGKVAKGQLIKTTLPITEVKDGRTQLTSSGQLMMKQYPEAMRRQINNQIQSINDGLFTGSSDLNTGKPLNMFFRGAPNGASISFEKTSNGVIPKIKNGSDSKKSNLTWFELANIGGVPKPESVSDIIKNYKHYFNNNVLTYKENGQTKYDYDEMIKQLSSGRAKPIILSNAANIYNFQNYE